MAIAEEIAVPLRSLAEVTWPAKQLYAIISGGDLYSYWKHIRHWFSFGERIINQVPCHECML
jgi:hypothetical protein